MKGGLDVVQPVDEEPEETTGDTTCASPRTTNVNVDIFDYGFTLTPSSAPCGTIVFAMSNSGTVEHDFNILALRNAPGGRRVRLSPDTQRR